MEDEKKKTAFLVRCTEEEADLIRHAAAVEHRTLSGYILNAAITRIKARQNMPQLKNRKSEHD